MGISPNIFAIRKVIFLYKCYSIKPMSLHWLELENFSLSCIYLTSSVLMSFLPITTETHIFRIIITFESTMAFQDIFAVYKSYQTISDLTYIQHSITESRSKISFLYKSVTFSLDTLSPQLHYKVLSKFKAVIHRELE